MFGADMFQKKTLRILLLVLFFELFTSVGTAHAQPSYEDVSSSINNAFNSSHVLLSTIITLVFFMFLVIIFRLSLVKKEQEWTEAANQKVKFLPQNPQQKRDWYRLKTDLRVKWIPLAQERKVKEKNSSVNYRHDFMIDLSGGGLCFVTSEEIKTGELLAIHLDLEGHPLLTQGTVIRVVPHAVEDSEMWKVSVEFSSLLTREREKIVSFIMNSQRSIIQSEKLKENTSDSNPEHLHTEEQESAEAIPT